MAIYYDETADTLGVTPDRCPNGCEGEDAWRNDTGCGAPGCSSARYDCCGLGCDAGFPGSRCEAGLAAESEEERQARHNRERAFWGLTDA